MSWFAKSKMDAQTSACADYILADEKTFYYRFSQDLLADII